MSMDREAGKPSNKGMQLTKPGLSTIEPVFGRVEERRGT